MKHLNGLPFGNFECRVLDKIGREGKSQNQKQENGHETHNVFNDGVEQSDHE